MAGKSTSPSKSRGRPRTRIPEAKDAKAKPATAERSKSRGGRAKSRGRSPTPKAAKRKSSTSKPRSQSKPRSRSASKPRKSEPKARGRSASRKSVTRKSMPRKSSSPQPTATPTEEKQFEKKESSPPAVRQRRSILPREIPKPSFSSLLGNLTPEAGDKKSAPVTRSSVAYTKTSPEKSKNKLPQFLNRIVGAVKSFGYKRTFGAGFWLLVLPLFVLSLHLLCSKDHCYVRFKPFIPKTIQAYADPTLLVYGAGLVVLQCALSALPVGRIVTGFGYRRAGYFQYRSNSLFCLTVSVALFCLAEFRFHLPNTTVLQSHRFKCVSAATVLSFCIALVLYLKSFISRLSPAAHRNHGSVCSPPGVTGNHLHDFVYGREISPKMGRTFDFGLVMLRTANAIWILTVLSTCIRSRSTGPVFGLNYSVALVAALQITYVIMGSFNEVFLLKSAFIQQGVGFISVFTTMVLTPFCATLPLRYLVDSKAADICIFCYPALAVLFVLGLAFIHYSNYLKYNNARVGGKTLRSGPWALVRHPNYLGELLCILAWTLPCGKILLPYAHLAFVALLVICRCLQTEKNTNADFRNYQQQVRYRVLPPVF